jgi:hypothetical protein
MAPIGVFSIVPPLMVRPSTTDASVSEFKGRESDERTVRSLVVSTVEEAYVEDV